MSDEFAGGRIVGIGDSATVRVTAEDLGHVYAAKHATAGNDKKVMAGDVVGELSRAIGRLVSRIDEIENMVLFDGPGLETDLTLSGDGSSANPLGLADMIDEGRIPMTIARVADIGSGPVGCSDCKCQ